MISDNQIRCEMKICKDFGHIPEDMTFEEYLKEFYGINKNEFGKCQGEFKSIVEYGDDE